MKKTITQRLVEYFKKGKDTAFLLKRTIIDKKREWEGRMAKTLENVARELTVKVALATHS